MTPALVIFDCDGVLVDNEPITNRELAADLTEHGLPLTTERCIDLFVGGTMKSVHIEARRLGAALPHDWVERFYERMFAALADEVEAVPGIAEAVGRIAAAGVPMAIGSNGPLRKMEITLGRTGLARHFDGCIFSAHEIGVAKPDPAFYAHVARTLGREPAECAAPSAPASGASAMPATRRRNACGARAPRYSMTWPSCPACSAFDGGNR